MRKKRAKQAPPDLGVCSTEGCDEPVKYKRAGVCEACYSGLYYWLKKSPTQVLQRFRQLAKLRNRMRALRSLKEEDGE